MGIQTSFTKEKDVNEKVGLGKSQQLISKRILAQFEQRFTFKVPTAQQKGQYTLFQKFTHKHFRLRVICTNDNCQKEQILKVLKQKLAFDKKHLIKVQSYRYDQEITYCSENYRFYILFEIGRMITMKEYVLKCLVQTKDFDWNQSQNGKEKHPDDYLRRYQQNVILNLNGKYRGLLSLILSVNSLKYLNQPHGNINGNQIYMDQKIDNFCLSDPWMISDSHQQQIRSKDALKGQDQIYPSQQKLNSIFHSIKQDNLWGNLNSNNAQEQSRPQFDSFANDLFAVGMNFLQMLSPGINLEDQVYKRASLSSRNKTKNNSRHNLIFQLDQSKLRQIYQTTQSKIGQKLQEVLFKTNANNSRPKQNKGSLLFLSQLKRRFFQTLQILLFSSQQQKLKLLSIQHIEKIVEQLKQQQRHKIQLILAKNLPYSDEQISQKSCFLKNSKPQLTQWSSGQFKIDPLNISTTKHQKIQYKPNIDIQFLKNKIISGKSKQQNKVISQAQNYFKKINSYQKSHRQGQYNWNRQSKMNTYDTILTNNNTSSSHLQNNHSINNFPKQHNKSNSQLSADENEDSYSSSLYSKLTIKNNKQQYQLMSECNYIGDSISKKTHFIEYSRPSSYKTQLNDKFLSKDVCSANNITYKYQQNALQRPYAYKFNTQDQHRHLAHIQSAKSLLVPLHKDDFTNILTCRDKTYQDTLERLKVNQIHEYQIIPGYKQKIDHQSVQNSLRVDQCESTLSAFNKVREQLSSTIQRHSEEVKFQLPQHTTQGKKYYGSLSYWDSNLQPNLRLPQTDSTFDYLSPSQAFRLEQSYQDFNSLSEKTPLVKGQYVTPTQIGRPNYTQIGKSHEYRQIFKIDQAQPQIKLSKQSIQQKRPLSKGLFKKFIKNQPSASNISQARSSEQASPIFNLQAIWGNDKESRTIQNIAQDIPFEYKLQHCPTERNQVHFSQDQKLLKQQPSQQGGDNSQSKVKSNYERVFELQCPVLQLQNVMQYKSNNQLNGQSEKSSSSKNNEGQKDLESSNQKIFGHDSSIQTSNRKLKVSRKTSFGQQITGDNQQNQSIFQGHQMTVLQSKQLNDQQLQSYIQSLQKQQKISRFNAVIGRSVQACQAAERYNQTGLSGKQAFHKKLGEGQSGCLVRQVEVKVGIGLPEPGERQDAQKVGVQFQQDLQSPELQSHDRQTQQTPKKQAKQVFDFQDKFQALFSRTIPEEQCQQSSQYLSESCHSTTSQMNNRSQMNFVSAQINSLEVPSKSKQDNEKQTQNHMDDLMLRRDQNKQMFSQVDRKDKTLQLGIGTSQERQETHTVQGQTIDHHLSLNGHVHKRRVKGDQVVCGQYVQQQYESGGKYKGFMVKGQRQGQGKFFYKDGGYYQGIWKNNMMHGRGKLFYDNGKLAYEGQWYMDEFHGRGKVYNDCAQMLQDEFDYRDFNSEVQRYWVRYQGQLSHDTKVGFGKLFLSNAECFEGQFREDRAHGKGKFYSNRNGGQFIRGIWRQGVLIKQIQIVSLKGLNLCQKFMKENQLIQIQIQNGQHDVISQSINIQENTMTSQNQQNLIFSSNLKNNILILQDQEDDQTTKFMRKQQIEDEEIGQHLECHSETFMVTDSLIQEKQVQDKNQADSILNQTEQKQTLSDQRVDNIVIETQSQQN